jgi:hypothetical protein
MALFLLSLGADPNIVNNVGNTPSELAQIPHISSENVSSSADGDKSTHNSRHHNVHIHQINNAAVLASHVENPISMMRSDAIIPFWVYSWCMLSKAFKSAQDFLKEKCESSIFASYFGIQAESKNCDHDLLQSQESSILQVVFETMDHNRQVWSNSEDHLDQETAKLLGYLGCTEQGQISDL